MNRHKSLVTALFVLVLTTFVAGLFADCDMMAMIAKRGERISWCNEQAGNFNDPYDFFTQLENWSQPGVDPDGYGLMFFRQDPPEFTTAPWHYQTGINCNYGNGYTEVMDDAIEDIMTDPCAVIVLGHARNSTDDTLPVNHPFHMVMDGVTWGFEHNGGFTDDLKEWMFGWINSTDATWLSTHPSQWGGDPNDIDDWLDSEIWFRYVALNIHIQGSALKGIYTAVNVNGLRPYLLTGTNGYRGNFIISDGVNTYAFRNAGDDAHVIYFGDCGEFWGVSSDPVDGFTPLSQYGLVAISRYGAPTVIPNFVHNTDNNYPAITFLHGTIPAGTYDADQFTFRHLVYVDGPATVASGSTVIFKGLLDILLQSTLTVNGTLQIGDNTTFTRVLLRNSSKMIVSGSTAACNLTWHSAFGGSTRTFAGPIPPGGEVGEIVAGSSVLVNSQGVLTTPSTGGSSENYVFIGSDSSDPIGWDGITFDGAKSANPYFDMNLRYCNVTKTDKIEVKGNTGTNKTRLKVYCSDFDSNGSIIIRNGNRLAINGATTDSCSFTNAQATPIVSYSSPVSTSYTSINGGNCSGILLSGSPTSGASIVSTNIRNMGTINANTNAITISGGLISTISSCRFNNNNGTGIYGSSTGTLSWMQMSTIKNNLGTEIYGHWDLLMNNFTRGNNTIYDAASAGGSDLYILYATAWDSGFNPLIDVSGNTINSEDRSRFYPNGAAYYFGSRSASGDMLDTVRDQIQQGDLEQARKTCRDLLESYPASSEAYAAVIQLFNTTAQIDQDFASMRDFLNGQRNLSTPETAGVIDLVAARSMMLEENYSGAMIVLDAMIADPSYTELHVECMLDEAYCYLSLREKGLTPPVDSKLKPATITDLIAMTNELLSSETEPEPTLSSDHQAAPTLAVSASNYPNPANPSTMISYSLPVGGVTRVEVYNIDGRRVASLVNENQSAGEHSVLWDGRDDNGRGLATGVYLYRVQSAGQNVTHKLTLLK
jgi:hypothetical protein